MQSSTALKTLPVALEVPGAKWSKCLSWYGPLVSLIPWFLDHSKGAKSAVSGQLSVPQRQKPSGKFQRRGSFQPRVHNVLFSLNFDDSVDCSPVTWSVHQFTIVHLYPLIPTVQAVHLQVPLWSSLLVLLFAGLVVHNFSLFRCWRGTKIPKCGAWVHLGPLVWCIGGDFNSKIMMVNWNHLNSSALGEVSWHPPSFRREIPSPIEMTFRPEKWSLVKHHNFTRQAGSYTNLSFSVSILWNVWSCHCGRWTFPRSHCQKAPF